MCLQFVGLHCVGMPKLHLDCGCLFDEDYELDHAEKVWTACQQTLTGMQIVPCGRGIWGLPSAMQREISVLCGSSTHR